MLYFIIFIFIPLFLLENSNVFAYRYHFKKLSVSVIEVGYDYFDVKLHFLEHQHVSRKPIDNHFVILYQAENSGWNRSEVEKGALHNRVSNLQPATKYTVQLREFDEKGIPYKSESEKIIIETSGFSFSSVFFVVLVIFGVCLLLSIVGSLVYMFSKAYWEK
ncbi:unnamed protein product [Caenorhabditis angaria]|uniref:Fibronectin type-III domain-containing protein n=1 Tax=Caenorhabditis angaria TaxID=860376 RepID=A0A9P1N8L6_9PELO|nr:unnamed protein product [Caenorhabditis angaria]